MNKHFDIIRPNKSSHRTLSRVHKIVVIVVLVVLLALASFALWSHKANSSSAYIQSDKYQALFLTNSQVYFGKLQRLNDGSYRLTDVFYIQSNEQTNPTSQEASDPAKEQSKKQPTLVKLGDELHGPTDEIIIRDNQVLFWENLKPDAKVSKAIEAYKKK